MKNLPDLVLEKIFEYSDKDTKISLLHTNKKLRNLFSTKKEKTCCRYHYCNFKFVKAFNVNNTFNRIAFPFELLEKKFDYINTCVFSSHQEISLQLGVYFKCKTKLFRKIDNLCIPMFWFNKPDIPVYTHISIRLLKLGDLKIQEKDTYFNLGKNHDSKPFSTLLHLTTGPNHFRIINHGFGGIGTDEYEEDLDGDLVRLKKYSELFKKLRY